MRRLSSNKTHMLLCQPKHLSVDSSILLSSPRCCRLQCEVAEAWAGVELEFTAVYGVRRYLNNSALISHIDRLVKVIEFIFEQL